MSFESLDRLMARTCGTRRFWATMKAHFDASATGILEFDEWEGLLELAREEGLLAVLADEQGNAKPVWISPFGPALLRLWRSLQIAKAHGKSAAQFSREFDREIEALLEISRKRANDSDREQAARREAAQSPNSREAARRRRTVEGPDPFQTGVA